MNSAEVTERLDAAVEAILAVRVALGGLPTAVPPFDAVDEGLRTHQDYQASRREFAGALTEIRSAGAGDKTVFAVEASANAMVCRAIEVGWRLGIVAAHRNR